MNIQEFDKIIWRDALTFVDFFATWCGPCQAMHPVIERFAQEMRGRAEVYKIDIDNRSMAEVVQRYRILSVPTLMCFRRGELLWRISGRIGYEQLVGVLDKLEQNEHANQA